MFEFNQKMLDSYLESDDILKLLHEYSTKKDTLFLSHQWLESMPAKRLVYKNLYPELSMGGGPKKILDVGGGFSALSRKLAKGHTYFLLDPMNNENEGTLEYIEKGTKLNWIKKDWDEHEPDAYDVVIANDIFPNVDQRLELFLEKYLPTCKELRMSITCYNIPKFYKVKRTDAEEILYVKAWDGEQTKRVLEKHIDRIEKPNLGILTSTSDSIFDNERQVFYVALRGDLN